MRKIIFGQFGFRIECTFSTTCTLRRIHAVVVVDTVNPIVYVHSERDSVQAFIAYAATETARMIRFPHRLQNLLEVMTDYVQIGKC